MRGKTTRYLCLTMAMLLPASVMLAEVRGAMALVTGTVALNGATLSHSTAIFAGDQLETKASSAITVTANGSTVLIGANSRVHYFGDSFALHLGSMQVNTSKGLKLQTDSVTVEPAKTSAKFSVDRSSDTVLVAALTGDVLVNNGEHTETVPEGHTATLKEKNDDRPVNGVKHPSNQTFFVFGGIVVGGGAAGFYELGKANEKKPISNQIP